VKPDRIGRDCPDRRHQPECDRQVVVAAFLGKVGGREVDGDAPSRQREPRRNQGRAHALAGFRHRLVGQTDHVERRHAGRNLHLHVHCTRLDTFERYCRNALDHCDARPGKYYLDAHGHGKNI
jgi:hypothetical protein